MMVEYLSCHHYRIFIPDTFYPSKQYKAGPLAALPPLHTMTNGLPVTCSGVTDGGWEPMGMGKGKLNWLSAQEEQKRMGGFSHSANSYHTEPIST